MTTIRQQSLPLDGASGRAGGAALIGSSATIRSLKHALPSLRGADVRLIAGSCVPLDAEVRQGRFSRVLYQRLALIQLMVTPLRERVEDIAAIAEECLWHVSEASKEAPLVIRDSALGELTAHPWPENV